MDGINHFAFENVLRANLILDGLFWTLRVTPKLTVELMLRKEM